VTPSTELDVALINIQNGARSHPHIKEVLDRLLTPLHGAPGLMVVTEATGWREHGMRRALEATDHLSERFGRFYQIRRGRPRWCQSTSGHCPVPLITAHPPPARDQPGGRT
jgi:hypothetical protein